MDDLVLIGGFGLDVVHILLVLALVGLIALWLMARAALAASAGKTAAEIEDLQEEMARQAGRFEEERARWQSDLARQQETDAEQRRLTREAVDVEIRSLTADRDRIAAELAQEKQVSETQRSVAREAEKKYEATKARSEEDEQKFAELAQNVMRKANSQFLELANETFTKHREGAQTDLKSLIQPIGENFEKFKLRVDRIEEVRTQDKSALTEQITAITNNLNRNTSETNKLVTALSAPKGGGRWGETTLRNVMEHAGLSEFCDFSEQTTGDVDGIGIRPDVLIKLPGGREIVVDSKVSIDDYLKAADEPDQTQRAVLLKRHGRNVRNHIATLASKAYQDSFSERVDFVALFIPGENFYAAALQYEPDLFDYAAQKQVIVVTPSTLLALAKAVAYGWRQEKAQENAFKAAELGRELYSRLVTLGSHFDKMGRALNQSVEAYNKFGGSLNSRVLSTARKFDDLKIAAPDKALEDIELLETRALLPERSGELTFDGGDTPAISNGREGTD